MSDDTPASPTAQPALSATVAAQPVAQASRPPAWSLGAVAAVVLAAGKGTRMKSRRPKVLHEVAGKPMLWHVLVALRAAGVAPERTVVVVGDGAAEVRAAIEGLCGPGVYRCVLQEAQRGTGHAALQARGALREDTGTVVVAYGDTPLLSPRTIRRLLARHGEGAAPVTLVTGHLDDPTGYGRIVRGGGRHASDRSPAADAAPVQAVVEERDASEAERPIKEINSGFCAFHAPWLWAHLPRVGPAPNGELYLTALPAMAVAEGAGVATLVLDEVVEALGVNTRGQLAEAEALARRRINQGLLDGGVTLQDPATTYVDAGVTVGPDSVIMANTHLQGATVIGEGCLVGPNAIVRDSHIGDRCQVVASVVSEAVLETDVTVGPFAHVRPGTRCGRGAAIGTGSEVNRTVLGPGSKMMHFGYLGDATVGRGVNVGAGTVTCNYDGERKHPTRIGEGAFVGSGTLLVAPVEVGGEALTGAGAVVLRDVPAGAKVAGVPARQIGWRAARPAGSTAGAPGPPAGSDGPPRPDG